MGKSLFVPVCPESWRVENWRILVDYRLLLTDVILQLRSPHISLSFASLLGAIICTVRRFLTCKCSRCNDRGLHTVLSPSRLSLMCVSGCSLLLCCAITHQSLLMLLAELHSGLLKGWWYYYFFFPLFSA